MKLISCPSCKSETVGPVNKKYPHGMPYVVRRWTGRQYPLITKCRRCSQPIKMTVVEFNGLPEMSDDQIEKYDLARETPPPKYEDPNVVPE